MDATVYSIGSSAFLKEIWMAVVSIIGTGGFTKLIQSGLLLGFLIMAFQTMFNAGRPVAVHQLAVAGLLYALMFGPTVNVAIEGVYDNQSHAVSNVPIGIAATGSLLSQVGYGLTNMFETAFSSPSGATSGFGMTEGAGYADALKMLMEIRRNGSDANLLSTIDGAGAGGVSNFRGSWDNYIRECTAMKIDLGETSIEQIYSAPDHMDGLRFESELFGTVITRNGNSQTLSCTEAFNQLESWTTSVVASDGVKAAIARQVGLGKTGGHGPLAEPDTDPFIAANGALGALSQSADGAQKFVQTAILEPIFHQAMAGRYRDIHDFSAATMINQALQQRNVQWAAEQTIFMSIVRPMITFIEGFAYAITPFMAFIIVLGGFGLKLAVKYGQMLLWIQLWLPVLAITNFFLYMVASSELAELDNVTSSFYDIHQAGERLGYWVAVGGMLAAATPILTLVLLTGSTYAMTSLAQKMGGSDHVDEKQVAPDALRQGAVMDQLSMQTSGQMTGRANTGSDQFMESLSLGEALNTSYQSSSQAMEQASNTFLGSFAQTFSAGDSRAINNARSESIQRGLSSMSQQTQQNVEKAAESWRKQHGLSEDYKEASEQAMAYAASVGGGARLPFGFFSAGITATSQEQQSIASGLSITDSDIRDHGGGFEVSSSDSAALARSIASSAMTGNTDTRGMMWNSQQASSLNEQASEVLSASESYQESAAASASIASGMDTRLNVLGHQVANNDAASSRLASFFQANPELNTLANDQAARWGDLYNMDANTALNAARLSVLSKSSSYGGNTQAHTDGANMLASVVSQTAGVQSPRPQADAGGNSGIDTSSMRTSGSVGGGAGASVPDFNSPIGNGNSVQSAVLDDFNAQLGHLNEQAATRASELTIEAQDQLVGQLNAHGPTSFSPTVLGAPNAERADDLTREQYGFDARGLLAASRMAGGGGRGVAHVLQGMGMDGNVAQYMELGMSGGEMPANAPSHLQQAYRAGQAVEAGETGAAVDGLRSSAAQQVAQGMNMPQGASMIYQASVMRDEAASRELFETGYQALRQEVARNAGVKVNELNEGQERLASTMAEEAFSGDTGQMTTIRRFSSLSN